MKKSRIYLLGAFSGILLALSFPPMPFFLLSYIGLVPLLLALELKEHRKFFLLLYLTFFIYHGGTNWWISSWRSETDPYLMASGIAVWLVHPFFFMIPITAYSFLRKKFGLDTALWQLPLIWTAFEWLHNLGDIAYPWLTLGYTQIYNIYWAQLADITGVWGLSFLILFLNVLFFKIILHFREMPSESRSIRALYKNSKLRNYSSAIILIILIPNIYGAVRVSEYDHYKLINEKPSVRIGIIQPNVDPWQKWASSVSTQIFLHRRLQDSLSRAVGGLDMAIWSETAIAFVSLQFNSEHDFSSLQDRIDASGTSLLTGFADIYFYKPGEKPPATAKVFLKDSSRIYDSFNSAILLNPAPDNERNPQIYHKMRLTPFAERLPYAEYLTFAKGWFEWSVGISSWQKGGRQMILFQKNSRASAKIGCIICIESIYPNFCRNFVVMGANILTVITNDGWYDYTFGPEQHYLIAAMRAIETKRYLARCANTGVSGFICPTGKTLLRAPQYKTIGIAASIPKLEEKTLYVRFGDWLPISCMAILIEFIWIIIFRRKQNKISQA